MKKYYCDCCGKEILKHVSYYKYLHHLDPDTNWNIYRETTKDLCEDCYNEVMTASIVKYREIMNKEKQNEN